MIDATALARHRAVTASSRYDAKSRSYTCWTLSALPASGQPGGLPPALRGDLLTEYAQRESTVTAASIWGKEVDALRPMDFEARIKRRLGFKAKNGQPTFVYWNHIPIMRLEANTPSPHIFLSTYHVGIKFQHTRALFALNAMLDYLLTGVRLSQKGVAITRRHEITPWPKTLHKPGLFIPVRGRSPGSPFWEARTFEFVSNTPVAYPGGSQYDPPTPFPVAWDWGHDSIEGLT